MLTALTIREFSAGLASQEPAPGGGSAAAVSGLLGLSLLQLAVQISPDPAAGPFSRTEGFTLQVRLDSLRGRLDNLADEDAAAFADLMAALSAPHTATGDESRRVGLDQAACRAAEVPLAIAEACREGMALGIELFDRTDSPLRGDIAMGVYHCDTGLTCALLNAVMNLPLISDTDALAAYRGRISLLRNGAATAKQRLEDSLYAAEPFAVMRKAPKLPFSESKSHP